MRHPKYQYRSENSFQIFEFVSEGPKGRIKKMVVYSETATKDVYNLAFGDYDEDRKSIDDFSISNNNDSLKVLATVASTVYAFMERHPNAWVFATGSTKIRTRLYRMGLTNNLDEISEDFIVLGYNKNENWEEFRVGEDYEAFLISKK